MEEWKMIGDSVYEISNYGNIRSNSHFHKGSSHNKLLRKTKTGYYQVCLYVEKKHTYPYVHRLVAFYFIENPNGYLEVNHIDGNKSNNHFSNLEWITRKNNIKHAFALGLKKSPLTGKFGKDNPLSKKVYQYKNGILIKEFDSLTECAKELSVDISTLSKACRGIQKTCKKFTFTY